MNALNLTEDELKTLVDKGGFSPLEALGIVSLIDKILAARAKDEQALIAHRVWEDNGGY